MAFDPETSERDTVNMRPKADRSIAVLLSDLANETILLVRQEIALLKAELREKFGRMGQGATALGIGAALALSGWFVLLACAVLALATVMQPWLAALIVAVVVFAIGGILLLIGKKRLDADNLVPRRTMRTLREDEEWIRERMR
jgi:archaellum biogenesis protein FlaJ (TadC family)